MRALALIGLALLAACGEQPPPAPQGRDQAKAPEPATISPTDQPAVNAVEAAPAAPPALLAEALTRQQWAKAENKDQCAPIALTDSGGQPGVARAATFGGGWAVAFDLPGLRSAYGVAGTGLLPMDSEDAAAHRARLAAQWPRFMELDQLPAPSFAGYGLEGAEAWPTDNPNGTFLHSLAYVRVGGQRCTYNVWSKVSRAHLEHMLESLRLLPEG